MVSNAAGLWIVLASTSTLPLRHYSDSKTLFVYLSAGNNTGLKKKFCYASKEPTYES